MKILVTIKRTPHRDVKMRITGDGSLMTSDIKFEVNPFDEFAIEEALRIREAKSDVEVVVVTIGGEICREQLLAALAMGADRAIRVDTEASLDGGQVAKCLAAVVEKESPELVMSGKLAVDDENGQIPAMLAALLGWPQASGASKIEFVDDATVKVTCEVDAGLEEVQVGLPAVISADLRLNEPRYASLPGIMKAKKKPKDVIPVADCGELGSERAKVTTYRELPPKAAGKIVGSVDELLKELSDKKLI